MSILIKFHLILDLKKSENMILRVDAGLPTASMRSETDHDCTLVGTDGWLGALQGSSKKDLSMENKLREKSKIGV